MKRQTTIGIILLAALLYPALLWSAQASSANDSKTDIRILIDVSGSMKKNDPNNLRQPALRLLTGLLPNDSTAGIWTFGQFVNMLLPPARVNPAWKERARQASRDIKSYGLFTNIEDTLLDASWDWQEPDPSKKRSLILLTDGLVDIDADPALNRASRQRILNEILPRLQQAGIHIHTIALSSDADEALLSQLSNATQGIYAQVHSAAELERVFLRLFEASTETESLPLQGNTIQVDDSIREMTLLIFHHPDAPPTRIIMPDGRHIDQQTSSSHISWHHEQRYDLITLKKPAKGTWTIEADMDPDNRVLVVTDLVLHSDRLPASIITTDQHRLEIHLSENDQPIINKNFLHFIKVTATLYNQRGEQERHWSLLDNGLRDDSTENDGIYTLLLDKPFSAGRHEIIINVDGTTFSRQQRLHFEAYKDPVITAIDITETGLPTLYITPISGLINSDNLKITVSINNETHTRAAVRQHRNEWQLNLDDLDKQRRHTLNIEIKGQRDGNAVHIHLEPLFFGKDPAIETAMTQEPPPTVAAPADTTTAPLQPSDEIVNGHKNDSDGSLWLALLQVVLFNGVAAIIGFILYKRHKAKHPRKNPLAALLNTEPTSAKTTTEEPAHE